MTLVLLLDSPKVRSWRFVCRILAQRSLGEPDVGDERREVVGDALDRAGIGTAPLVGERIRAPACLFDSSLERLLVSQQLVS